MKCASSFHDPWKDRIVSVINAEGFRVLSVDEEPGRDRAKIEATVECEGVEKPVCVAQLVVLTLP